MSNIQIKAVLEGLALGDALGWPVEFYDSKRVTTEYGANGITEVPDPAIITDDTQMTLALCKALVDQYRDTSVEFIYHLANRFKEWSLSPDNSYKANHCQEAIE